MDTTEDNKEKDKTTGRSSVLSDILGSDLLDAPVEIVKAIIKNVEPDEAGETSVMAGVSEALSSAKEAIGEAAESAVEVAGGIADAVGEVVSNIDL